MDQAQTEWLPAPAECPAPPDTMVEMRESPSHTPRKMRAGYVPWYAWAVERGQYRIVRPAQQPEEDHAARVLETLLEFKKELADHCDAQRGAAYIQFNYTDAVLEELHTEFANAAMKQRDIEGMAKPVRSKPTAVQREPRDIKANLLIEHNQDARYCAWGVET